VAVVAYARLVQRLGEGGGPITAGSTETRVWEKKNGQWRHVHFHRNKIS
jgi:calcium/calmodulin-dependent protein kinase (CaM kinase) II